MATIASLYEITRQIGSGGGGIIYLGRHLRLGKDVVLKADKRPFSQNAMDSLTLEADTLKNLRHACIPQIYDFVVEGGVVYTVMEYIEGESLDEALRRGEAFAPRQVVRWAMQALEALDYLHGSQPNGILHSDIKPANLMRTPEGDIRLIDFNVALALGDDEVASVGRSHGYASPEHYGMGLDARSDIYGLGATMYHLLAGRRPARDAKEVVPLAAADCPPRLAAIVNKAMSPDKGMRFQSAGDMLAALASIRKDDPRARSYARLRAAAAAALASLFAAGAFAAFAGLKRMEQENRAEAYAEASQNAYLKGDRPGAIRLAIGAIPAGGGFFTPPASAAAQKALADALGAYDLSDGFKAFQTISLPSEPFMAELSPDGRTAAIVYAYEAAVVDLESGQSVLTLPMARTALAEARFLGGSQLVCAGRDGLCAYGLDSKELLWQTDFPAAAIAVSADGKTIAAASGDGGSAMLIGAGGEAIATIGFGGRKRRDAAAHMRTNPRGDLFALSWDGRALAASFTDGSLWAFDVGALGGARGGAQGDSTGGAQGWHLVKSNYNESNYVRYEGGFSGSLLAFSATYTSGSYFAVYSADGVFDGGASPLADGAFAPQFGVSAGGGGPSSGAGGSGEPAGGGGAFVSWDDKLAWFNPASGKMEELTLGEPCKWSDSNIRGFAVGEGHTLVATDAACTFFDKGGRLVSRFERDSPTDILLISGGHALVGGRGSMDIEAMRLERHGDAEVFDFGDSDYGYQEARVSADGSRAILYSADGFRLYGRGGALLREQAIPDPARVNGIQFSKASGNLAVMYSDALLVFGGRDGEIVFEETGLRSVFCAPYGASVLDAGGRLRLIDLDSCEDVLSVDATGEEAFAAFCGMPVDSAFLGGRRLIGAAKVADGYLFAVAGGAGGAGGVGGAEGSLYDGDGNKLFDFPADGQSKAFFTGSAVVVSPARGAPSVFSLGSGKKVCELENITNLTDIAEIGGHLACRYTAADGERNGVLLDGAFQPVADLPRLCDTLDGQLVFDYPQGVLRRSRIYGIDELAEQGEAELAALAG